MDYSILLYLLAALLVLAGFVGIALPALPGTPLVFAGLLTAAWTDGFAHVGWLPLTVIGVLALIALVVDALSTTFGAQRVGASRLALAGSLLGTVIGLFFMPIGLSARFSALCWANTCTAVTWARPPRSA